MFKNLNIWFVSSLLVSVGVLIPIITVFFSFFESTSNYYEILKNTFLLEYIFNSAVLLISVLILTFLIGTISAYLVSFYKFPFSDFFKWGLILSFAVPPIAQISSSLEVSPSLTLKITFGILNPLIISNSYKFFLCPKPVFRKG